MERLVIVTPLQALREIREVWAGAECGDPVHAQEAYAIGLCKQMYDIAVEALRDGRELEKQVVAATQWLNADGSPCDGFRFREEMLKLRQMVESR